MVNQSLQKFWSSLPEDSFRLQTATNGSENSMISTRFDMRCRSVLPWALIQILHTKYSYLTIFWCHAGSWSVLWIMHYAPLKKLFVVWTHKQTVIRPFILAREHNLSNQWILAPHRFLVGLPDNNISDDEKLATLEIPIRRNTGRRQDYVRDHAGLNETLQ